MKKLLLIWSLIFLCSYTFALSQPSIGDFISQKTESKFYAQSQCVDGDTVYKTEHLYVGDTYYWWDNIWSAPSDDFNMIFDKWNSKIIVIDPYSILDLAGGFKWKATGLNPNNWNVIYVEKNIAIKRGSLPNGGISLNQPTAQIVVNLHRGWYYKNQNDGPNYWISYKDGTKTYTDNYQGNQYKDNWKEYILGTNYRN